MASRYDLTKKLPPIPVETEGEWDKLNNQEVYYVEFKTPKGQLDWWPTPASTLFSARRTAGMLRNRHGKEITRIVRKYVAGVTLGVHF
jgi:hypothetical protein